jgi:hypothetical protein
MSIRKIHVSIFIVGPMLKLLGIRAQMRSEVGSESQTSVCGLGEGATPSPRKGYAQKLPRTTISIVAR